MLTAFSRRLRNGFKSATGVGTIRGGLGKLGLDSCVHVAYV